MIRELQAEEVESITHMGQEFFTEAKLPGGFKKDVFCKTWSNLISLGMGIILAAYKGNNQTVGALGAVIVPDLNDGDLVAQEAFWFMSAESRGSFAGARLLRAFEEIAKERGAKRLIMVHLLSLNADKLGKFYERMGYRATEVNFVKVI